MDRKCEDWTFENWDEKRKDTQGYRIAKRYADNWDQVKTDNHGILLYGPPGTGKTFIAASIANHLIRQRGVPVAFVSSIDIINKIYSGYGRDDDGTAFLNSLNRAALLIIDDLGAESKGKSGKDREIIYQIVDNRLRSKRPMIVTSNYTMDELRQRLDYDGVNRIVDRLAEICVPIKIDGPSIRQQKAAQKRTEFIKLLTE